MHKQVDQTLALLLVLTQSSLSWRGSLRQWREAAFKAQGFSRLPDTMGVEAKPLLSGCFSEPRGSQSDLSYAVGTRHIWLCTH